MNTMMRASWKRILEALDGTYPCIKGSLCSLSVLDMVKASLHHLIAGKEKKRVERLNKIKRRRGGERVPIARFEEEGRGRYMLRDKLERAA